MNSLAAITLMLFGSPARATDWELGVGTRDSLAEPGRVEGARLVGRRVFPGLALEASLYATPRAPSGSALGATLLQIVDVGGAESAMQYPMTMDRATAELRLDLGARPAERERAFSGGPHLYLGVEGRMLSRYALTLEGGEVRVGDPETVYALGPTLGAGVDAWYRGRVGLRLVIQDRSWWGDELVYELDGEPGGRTLHHHVTTSLDLLLAF